MSKLKLLLTWKNVSNAIFVLVIIMLLISPQAKGLLISGIMKMGLMRAPTKSADPAASPAPAINILLRSPDGKTLQTGEKKGKVLILNFWATWCPPCIAEMGSINTMCSHYKQNDGVLVLTIDADSDFEKSLAFMKRGNYSLPVYQIAGKLPKGLFSGVLPTTIIIGKDGQVVARHEGAANYADEAFYEYLDKLIAQ